MARQKNVILEFEGKLGQLLKSFDQIDKSLKGQIGSIKNVEKANLKLLAVYEKQARALAKRNSVSEKRGSNSRVSEAEKIRKEVEKTLAAQKRLQAAESRAGRTKSSTPVVVPIKAGLSSTELANLRRRITTAMGGTAKTPLYAPVGKTGKPLAGGAMEAHLQAKARSLNVPTDNLSMRGPVLADARKRDMERARAEHRAAAEVRLERMRTSQAARQKAAADAQAAKDARSQAAQVRLNNINMKRRYGINSNGSLGGMLGNLTGNRPIMASALSPQGGLSGMGVARMGMGVAGKGAATMIGGALGGAGAMMGGPIGGALMAASFAAAIQKAVVSGVQLGFTQAFKLSGLSRGFSEIMGETGFDPVRATDTMTNSRQQLLTGTQSRSEADRLFKYVAEISKKTPFQVKDYTHAAAVGARYDVDVSKSYGTDKNYSMGKALGDLAAGNNKQLEDSIFTFLHEYIATADARSLKYRFSITPEQMLSTARSQGFKGNANTVEGRAAMVSDFAKGQYGGSMDRKSATLSGKVADIADSFMLLQDAIGQTGAYMSAVNFFERIRKSLDDLDTVNPDTGTSKLDQLSNMFTQFSEYLNAQVIEPIVFGIESLFAEGGLDRINGVITAGILKLAAGASNIMSRLIVHSAWELIKSPFTGMANLGRSHAEGYLKEKNLSVESVDNGVSNQSDLMGSLKAAGLTTQALKGLGVVKEGDRAGWAGGGKVDYLTSDTALADVAKLMTSGQYNADQLNTAGRFSPTIGAQTALLTESQAAIMAPGFNEKSKQEQAVLMSKNAGAAEALETSMKKFMEPFGGEKATEESQAKALSLLAANLKNMVDPNSYDEAFGLLKGYFNETSMKPEDLLRNKAQKSWENTSKPTVDLLGKIFGAILDLKGAIMESISKSFDLRRDQKDAEDAVQAREGESPYKQQQDKLKDAREKAQALDAEIERSKSYEMDSEGNFNPVVNASDEMLAAAESAWAQVADIAGQGAANDAWGDPGTVGNGFPGSQGRAHAEQKAAVAEKGELNELRAARQQEKAAAQKKEEELLAAEGNRKRGVLLGDGKNKGTVQTMLEMLRVPQEGGAAGAVRPLNAAEISTRTSNIVAMLAQNDQNKRLGLETLIPSSILESFGGGTTRVDREGKPVTDADYNAMTALEKSNISTVSMAGFMQNQLAAAVDPRGAQAFDTNQTIVAAKIDATNVYLDQILKALGQPAPAQTTTGAPRAGAPSNASTTAAAAVVALSDAHQPQGTGTSDGTYARPSQYGRSTRGYGKYSPSSNQKEWG